MSVIVTGVDGSETAAAAAQAAVRLAAAFEAELMVVCVYDKYEVEELDVAERGFTYSTHDEAMKTAEAAIAPMLAGYSDLKLTPRAIEGKPADVLVRVATDTKAEVIVVGNKRVQGPARILGSIATSVARHAPCDVYIAYTHER